MVNHAGVGTPSKFAETALTDVMQILDLNFRAPLAITDAFFPRLKKRKSAGIIVVSSTIGYGPAPYLSVYDGLKSAIRQFGSTLHRELALTGVDVLVVSPGTAKTDMAEAMMGNKIWIAGAPSKVPKADIRALGRKGEVVSGIMNKIMTIVTGRLMPESFAAWMNGKLVELMLPDANPSKAAQSAS